MTNIFTAPNNTSQQMADSLPQGRAWGKKNITSSNTRKLINSLAVAHNSTQKQIQLLDEQFRINNTTNLLQEWETSVGIPDGCASGKIYTNEERRNAVINRFKKDPIVTIVDMQAYIDEAIPDIQIILYAGEDYPNYPATPPFTPLTINKKFLIVGEIQLTSEAFVYEFDFPFTGGIDTATIECIMNQFIPANVILLLYYT